MADGLYVVGDTLQDLHENFMEVLDRARKSGLTFKPKKIVVAPKTQFYSEENLRSITPN